MMKSFLVSCVRFIWILLRNFSVLRFRFFCSYRSHNHRKPKRALSWVSNLPQIHNTNAPEHEMDLSDEQQTIYM